MLFYYTPLLAPIPTLNIPTLSQSSRPPHQRQRQGALLTRNPAPQAHPQRRARWQIQDTAGRKGGHQGAFRQTSEK